MDYKELLRELLSSLNISQKKFAEQLGLSQGNVSDWFNRPKYRPSIDALKRISETYNVNLNWLITGEGDMYNVRAREGLLPRSIKLPVVGDIAAGFPQEIYLDEPVQYIDVPFSLLTLPPPYHVFTVDGESMLPLIQPGDFVIISADWRGISLNSRICAFRTADGITLKQYVLDKSHKTAWLWPVNSAFNPIQYKKTPPILLW